MAPFQIDLNEEQYKVEIFPSKIAEMIAVMRILVDSRRYESEREFIDRLHKKLTVESINFLNLISGIKFPGADFFGFFLNEGIYHDFDLFIEKISGYHDVDFIYLAFDREISREKIEAARNDRGRFQSLVKELTSSLWQGGTEPIQALVYNTANYKNGLINLAREIYNDEEFSIKVDGLSGVYKQSVEDIRRRLLNKSPLDLAMEIKNKNFTCKSSYARYYFLPTFFLHDLNIAGWNEDIFMLFYNVKDEERVDNEEIDKVLATFKSLSDRTRLQILQHLRSKPSYGKLLAERLKLSTATISRHLEQLRAMDLIVEEKTDNYKYFKLNKREIDGLLKNIQEFLSEK